MDERIDSMMQAQDYSWRDILNQVLKGMNPWDVDIIELASRYSSKVDEMMEMNFRLPANVVLVSSVLLRMKADLLTPPKEKDPYAIRDHMLFVFESNFPVEALLDLPEGELYPIEMKPARMMKRRVSAEELIDALQSVLREKERAPKKKKSAMQAMESSDPEVIVKNKVSIILLIEETYQKIAGLLSSKEEVVLSELAKTKDELISTFISLLHLVNDRKISLRQENLYDEIYIHTV